MLYLDAHIFNIARISSWKLAQTTFTHTFNKVYHSTECFVVLAECIVVRGIPPMIIYERTKNDGNNPPEVLV